MCSKHLLCALLNSGETENGRPDEVYSRQQEYLCKGPGAALDCCVGRRAKRPAQVARAEQSRGGREGGDEAGRLGEDLGLHPGGVGRGGGGSPGGLWAEKRGT